jgi:hypothetical protein
MAGSSPCEREVGFPLILAAERPSVGRRDGAGEMARARRAATAGTEGCTGVRAVRGQRGLGRDWEVAVAMAVPVAVAMDVRRRWSTRRAAPLMPPRPGKTATNEPFCHSRVNYPAVAHTPKNKHIIRWIARSSPIRNSLLTRCVRFRDSLARGRSIN